VLKDDKQSVYWYQKAADQGYAEAQSKLCFCLPLISCFLIPVHGLLIVF
jgi:TPR repeat protein